MASESAPVLVHSPTSVTRVFCNCCQQQVDAVALYQVAGCNVVRCRTCELVFVCPGSIAPQHIAQLYSREYFEGGKPDGYADYNTSEEVLRAQARRTLRKLRHHCPSGSLLELGCAYGFFLLEAKNIYKSSGIELSEFAAQQARSRGLEVTCGDFLQVPCSTGSFELVCLFDCIEHLTNPFGYLRKINEVLKPRGLVCLTTGDIGSFYARLAGPRWRLMTPPQHLFFFSRTTIGRMLTNAGFDVIEVSYPWKLVPWPLVLYQLSPKLKAFLGPLGRLPFGFLVNLFDAMFVLARKR